MSSSFELRSLFAAASLCVAVLAGCASTPPSGPAGLGPQYAALIKYPDRLKAATGPMGGYLWIAPNANMKQYDKVLLTRILVTLDQSENKTVDPVTQAKLTAYFRSALVKALEPKFPVVMQPGPGVLVVRATLVDLVPVNVAEDVAYQAVPFGAGVVAELAEGPVTGEGFGSAPFLGRTGIVAQFFDGQTNQLIGEYADTQFGKQYVVNLSKGATAAAETGWDQYWKGLKSWGYAQEAFTGWAQAFRRYLDKVHAQ
jgi:Protein of unknown function (DUF3313)